MLRRCIGHGAVCAWVAWIVWIAAACVAPSTSLAISGQPPVEGASAAWTPALSAWGARAQSSAAGAVPGPPALGGAGAASGPSPALSAVGMSSVDAVASGGAASQREIAVDETQRWVPAFALTSSMLGQEAEGSVDSNSTITYSYVVQINNNRPANAVLLVTRSLREGKVNFFSPNGSSRPTALVPGTPTNPGGLVLPAQGSNLILTPTVGMALELMTPGLQDMPGRPRLFFHGDSSAAFGIERSFGREGVPDGAQFPPSDLYPRPQEVQVNGIGSITQAEMKTLLISGGLGVAFTLDAWERRLRIKPSFEYLREELEVRGRLVRAFQQSTGKAPPNATNAVFLPTIDLESQDTLTTYGVGPGLELEMDAARAGPFVLSLYLSGQAYRMLGDRTMHLESSTTIDVPDGDPNTPATQEVSAQWDFNKHAWSYRGGLGVRFRWLPEIR